MDMWKNIFFVAVTFLSPYFQSTAKTIHINPHEDVTTQFKCENATYIISGSLDLNGMEIVIPKCSTLSIKKNALISNGQLKGNQTRLKPQKVPFLKNVILSGSFTNTKAYLSWWNVEDDITEEVNSLFAVFDGTIFLNKSGRLSKTVLLIRKSNVIVDGCNNEFVLSHMPGTGIFAKENGKVEFKNMRIAFEGPYLLKNNSFVERCFRIQHGKSSTVCVHDISFTGFRNDSDKPCSFCGIDIVECNEGTQTYVYNVKVSNIAVVGDGIESTGPGSNYGIKVSCQTERSGKVEIHDCELESMCNYGSFGEMIFEDTSGIYLAGISAGSKGKQICSKWDALVKNCTFKDISKRNVKVQGDYVRIENLKSDCSVGFLPYHQNMYIGATGNHLYVRGLRGRYDGTIVKITGDYLEAKDIHCSSELRDSEYARVFTLDGCTHEKIENCTFNNDTYIFIYPTEKGFTEGTVPSYSISNCDINVKHLIYCVSKQQKIYNEGILEVDNSCVNLGGTFCSNKQAMKEFVLRRTRLTAAQPELIGRRKDGRSPVVTKTKSNIELVKRQ